MKEREPIPTQTFIRLSTAVDLYASEDVLWDPGYNQAIGEIGLRVGADTNPQIHMGISIAIGQGITMATTRIRQLVVFSDPQARRELIQKIQRGELQGRWLLRLAQWNMQEDPYGLEALEECKRRDMEEVEGESREAKDEPEEIQIKAQAEALGRGQGLIVNFYRKQIGASKVG